MIKQAALFETEISEAKKVRTKRADASARSERVTMLVEEARQHEIMLGEIDDRIYQIQASYDALKAGYYAAVDALWCACWPFNHSPEAKLKRKPLYESRMIAGMAWCPVRKEYDELTQARKKIAVELKCINGELDQ